MLSRLGDTARSRNSGGDTLRRPFMTPFLPRVGVSELAGRFTALKSKTSFRGLVRNSAKVQVQDLLK